MAEFQEFSIRPVRAKDYTAWRELRQDFLASTGEPGKKTSDQGLVWEALMRARAPFYGIVACAGKSPGEQPVGLCHLCATPGAPGEGMIEMLYVTPSWRGCGMGDALLHGVWRIAGMLDWRCLVWYVAEDNYPARALFDRHGAVLGRRCYSLTSVAPRVKGENAEQKAVETADSGTKAANFLPPHTPLVPI